MADPVLYASPRQFVGVAREVTQGTAVAPVITVPVDTFDPFDQPTFIDDNGLRGSMTGPYNVVQGPIHAEFATAGPAFFDTLPYYLSNIMGDQVYSGTYTGSGTTTLSVTSAVGATSLSIAASIAASTLVQIDTGTKSEVRLTTGVSGAGPYVITFTEPLVNAHTAPTCVVKPIGGPFSQAFSVLNSGTGQPSSHTFTDWQGPTASTQARAYAGGCLSALNIKGTPESSVIMYDGSGMGWPSTAAAVAPTANPSAVKPQAAWETQVGLNGTVVGTPIKTVTDWQISIARVIKPYYTAQNVQTPYFIHRGRLTVSGKINVVAADETALTYMINNTQPQLQLIVSNGLAGTSLLSLQVDILQAAFSASKINRGNTAVEYAIEFKAVANTSDAGYSGGYSPLLITTQNNVATNTWPYF